MHWDPLLTGFFRRAHRAQRRPEPLSSPYPHPSRPRPRGRFGRFWEIAEKDVGTGWNYSHVMWHAGPANPESLVMTEVGAFCASTII
jgi:hypothetical protein